MSFYKQFHALGGMLFAPEEAQSTVGSGWRASVKTGDRDIIASGTRWVGIACAVFLVWGLFFPLSSAVVAPGTLISKGRNQLLQHAAGGVVEEILAANGDHLFEGDPIVRIDPSAARAHLAKLEARQALLQAQEQRLAALRIAGDTGYQTTEIDVAALRGVSKDPAAKVRTPLGIEGRYPILDEQLAAFDASLLQSESEVSALRNRRAGQADELTGLNNQIAAKTQKLALLEGDLAKMEPLVAEGYISQTRFNEKRAGVMEDTSQLAALKARAGTMTAQIAETEDSLATLIARKNAENAEELSAVFADLAAVQKEIDAARIALNQTVVRAPAKGILVKFEANTVGGVIEGGKSFGEIVPVSGDVVVEARVAPQDIGAIKVGQETEVVITAFKRGQVDPFPGAVTYAAADSKLDELTGEPYFEVLIYLKDATDRKSITVQPGMLTEVYIQTGSRSFFGYLLQPVTDSFLRAFRER